MNWIRPSVITLLSLAMVSGFFMGKIAGDVFVPFATGLIVFWFKSRDDKK
ncbi:hypothetical protein LCGC14_0684620 [marine sediment metagenome]|uniref:Uncharacterized protein n=1 Tax=marine sediment metagenome TaxID=412755 RepID=A0A0F9T8I5_9ZZZZ